MLTLDRYGHLFPDDLDSVATAFDAAAQTAADWLRTGEIAGPGKPLAAVKKAHADHAVLCGGRYRIRTCVAFATDLQSAKPRVRMCLWIPWMALKCSDGSSACPPIPRRSARLVTTR